MKRLTVIYIPLFVTIMSCSLDFERPEVKTLKKIMHMQLAVDMFYARYNKLPFKVGILQDADMIEIRGLKGAKINKDNFNFFSYSKYNQFHLDAWGSPIHFLKKDDSTYILVSSGHDKSFDNSLNDDIFIEIDLEKYSQADNKSSLNEAENNANELLDLVEELHDSL